MMQEHSKWHVLLVDDDRIIRDVVKEMLQALGYTVACAKDGPEALERFKDGGGIHIVMTDIMMPEMDGWQLAHRIKSIKPSIPIVALTGAGPETIVPKLNNTKGIGFALFKPLKMANLKDTLQEIVATIPLDGCADVPKSLPQSS